eukprot:1158406-Pelagomonas_calceolata.AAC.9
MATMYNVILHGEVRRAVCGLASQLWVSGRADGNIKEEQIGTLIGGWMVVQGGPIQKFGMASIVTNFTLLKRPRTTIEGVTKQLDPPHPSIPTDLL